MRSSAIGSGGTPGRAGHVDAPIAQIFSEVAVTEQRLKEISDRNALQKSGKVKGRAGRAALNLRVEQDKSRVVALETQLGVDKLRLEQAKGRQEDAEKDAEDLAERQRLAPQFREAWLKQGAHPDDVENAVSHYLKGGSDEDATQLAFASVKGEQARAAAEQKRRVELQRRRDRVDEVLKEEREVSEAAGNATDLWDFAESKLGPETGMTEDEPQRVAERSKRVRDREMLP